MHAAAIEPGSSSPKLYSTPSSPQLIMIWLMHVARRRTSATPPRLPGVSLPSSQPAGCTSPTRVRARREVGEFVEADGAGRGRRDRRDAVATPSSSSSTVTPPMPSSPGRSKLPSFVAIVVDVARELHADLLAEVVLDRVEAGRDRDAGEDAVHARRRRTSTPPAVPTRSPPS